jgi:hypothetical protein
MRLLKVQLMFLLAIIAMLAVQASEKHKVERKVEPASEMPPIEQDLTIEWSYALPESMMSLLEASR